MSNYLNPINTIIIDEDAQSIEALIYQLKKTSFDFNIVGIANNLKTGKQLLLNTIPEILFVNDQLQDDKGRELLNEIASRNCRIIYITADENYSIKTCKADKLNYLVKPISSLELNLSITSVLKIKGCTTEEKSNFQKLKRIAIPHQEGSLYLLPDEIIYVKAYGEYCYFITETQKILLSKTLKDVEDVIKDQGFIRVHRSYLVNIQKIRFFRQKGKATVKLSNGEEIEVSRRRKESVAEAIRNRVIII